ncbi:MAG: S8 family serine peptidase [candidate division Zixibacteria bacterium]|nr:S8 family serine peptidase [candidate division Zixibacteria bacterium]
MQRLSITLSAVVLILCGMVLSVTDCAHAGRIEPNFEQLLQTAGPDEMIPVMIRPVGTVTGHSLKKQLATAYKTRGERHRAAITTLKTTADATQPAIRRALASKQYEGRVNDVRSFWIDNVITANMTPSAIAEIASRADVDEVVYMPRVEFYRSMDDYVDGSPAPAGTEAFDAVPGIRAVRADSVWAMGYTGKGRLVASIDTGVDGLHNFLKDKWRGNNGYSPQESWFHPLDNSTVPRTFPGESDQHGTFVMGIMVAIQDSMLRDDPDLDTVGVAIESQWITAGVIDVTGANILESMQWCADPDGDPNTELDVPDVVNNSWGAPVIHPITGVRVPYPCTDVFWNGIDNVEAAGAVMLFAAGNEGVWGERTTRDPGNRAITDLNAFCVGMIDPHDSEFPAHPLSSQGPSECDGVSIKPEVVAPGVAIQTTAPNGFMKQDALGTSFAVPYVSGGVALMREYNPNATVDQIKQALIDGATDLGEPGPDNLYGHGLINLKRSIELLPPNDQPTLYIKRDQYLRPGPGESTEMVITLRSAGTEVDDVMVTVVSEDPRLVVVDGIAPFGDFVSFGDTASNAASPFEFEVSETALEGERLNLRFEMTGSGGYSRTTHGAIQVGPTRTDDVYTHVGGNFVLSIASMGMFGMHPQSIAPRFGGLGYSYRGDTEQSMFEGAFLVGIGPDQVSDNARDEGSFPDFDFQVDPGGQLEITTAGSRYVEETRSAFSDAIAENPIGLFIVQRTFVSDNPDDDDYLTVEYTIYNRSGAPIEDLHAGLYFDWDFPWLNGGNDGGGYDLFNGVGWMVGSGGSRYRGIAVLTPPGATSYRHFLNDPEIYSQLIGDTTRWNGFTKEEKWDAMTGGFTQTEPPSPQDGSHLIATGPFNIAVNDSIQVAFAIIGANSEEDLLTFAGRARLQYATGTVSVTPGSLNFTALLNGNDPDPKTLTISNLTATQVTFDVTHTPEWALVSPLTGSILNGSNTQLTVAPDTDTLGVGTYADSVVVVTDDESLSRAVIPVTLTIEAQQTAPVEPNPFNPAEGPVTMRLAVNSGLPERATATIYDIAGFKVRDIRADEVSLSAGMVEVLWDGHNDDKVVANGVYFGHIKVEVDGGPGIDKTYTIVLKK